MGFDYKALLKCDFDKNSMDNILKAENFPIMPIYQFKNGSGITFNLESSTSYKYDTCDPNQDMFYKDGYIFCRANCGEFELTSPCIPDIKNVTLYPNDLNPKVVIMEFCNGDIQKAVLSKEDEFNLEQGISICIAKEAIACRVRNSDRATSYYNKIVNRALKVYKKSIEDRAKKIGDDTKKKKKRILEDKKKKEKQKRRIQRENERMIAIQKEAYIQAMQEMKVKEQQNEIVQKVMETK